MIEVGTVLLMVTFSLLAIHARLLRHAVIFLAIFSLLTGFLYVQFAAPELAIAEAVIGSGPATLLYLAALKRNRVYTIGVIVTKAFARLGDRYVEHFEQSKGFRELRTFFVRRELEVQTVYLTVPMEDALADPSYDLVLSEDGDGIVAYTDEESYVMVELELVLQMHGTESSIRVVRHSPEAVI